MKSDMLLGAVSLIAILVAGAVAVSAIYARPSYAQPGYTGQASHVIAVSATGSASTLPSMAKLYLNVNGSGASTQGATANLSSAIDALNKTINPYINGNLSLIATTYYSVQKNTCPYGYYPTTVSTTTVYGQTPVPAYQACNTSRYTATESLTVTIPGINNASAALTALSGIPNVYVSNINTALSTPQITALRQEALQQALTNATMQAQAVAGNAALSVRNITVSSYNIYPGVYFNAATSGSSGKQATIFGGTSSVTESITVTFNYT